MLEKVQKLAEMRNNLESEVVSELFKKFGHDIEMVTFPTIVGPSAVIFYQKSTRKPLAKIAIKFDSNYNYSFSCDYYDGALMENSLVGKYALVAYDNDICLDNVKKIVEDKDDTIKTECGKYFYKSAILKTYDKPEDADYILSQHKKYMEMKSNHRKIESEFRDAVLGAIKYF